ncbi:MAG: hypothetical protein CMC67_02700 [Flavobacteriaceae bacterium]|nr:hypothetical protein [Flavobacteriaceae bacterium]|tara:strand:- start:643 stop:1551 length:909 start_codon:yes stop_codon:yes gene_type:complete
MKFQNLFFLKIVFFLLFFSCNNNDDDDNSDDNPLAIRDAAEQAIVDDNILKSYLETHFYNYEDFSSAPNDYSISIKIDSLDESNDDKNPLINYVQEKEVIVKQDGIDIPQKLYYIIVREGKGVKPNNVDSTFVSYKGSLVNGFIFDQRDVPIWFDLAKVVKGFRMGMTNLKSGTYEINLNGTYTFKDYGQGIFFIPSALGYFNNSVGGIPAYSPLIFTVNFLTLATADHDSDGLDSYLEDINLDGDPLNDDTDQDSAPNLYDPDDDNDGVFTINELDKDGDGVIDDTDGDGIPDYLDPNISS